MQTSIDLETLGHSPSAPILSIGLVLFDDVEILSRHEWFPDVQEQLDRGAKPDASTLPHCALSDAEAQALTVIATKNV